MTQEVDLELLDMDPNVAAVAKERKEKVIKYVKTATWDEVHSLLSFYEKIAMGQISLASFTKKNALEIISAIRNRVEELSSS